MFNFRYVGSDMTWFVRFRLEDGTVPKVLCHTRPDVAEHLREQKAQSREVWVEDVDGRQIEESEFA